MRLSKLGGSFALVAAALAVPPTFGPAAAQQIVQRDPRVVSALDSWGYQPLYSEGWSAKRLFDSATVYGPGGDELGELTNILLDRQGAILGVTAEVGGFLGVGDTNVFVPWDQVKFGSLRRVYIPVTGENVGDYRASPSVINRALTNRIGAVAEDSQTGRGIWKATDFINDYVYLSGRREFGYVRDLIFNGDGQLYAYVVSADASWGGGNFALPYSGDPAVDPTSDHVYAPFAERDVQRLDRFDYGRMNDTP